MDKFINDFFVELNMPRKKTTTSQAPKKETKPADSLQPEINIGLIGHVDHGKTTLVKALSGKWTDTHSEEMKRGITIRLGYADVTVYKCSSCKDGDAFGINPKCAKCKKAATPIRKFSLVDAPGHESLMATMICGASIIDGALLLISANEDCPQPQTMEHVMALQIIGIKNVIVVQNKIDLVTEEQAVKNQEQIKEFLKETPYADAPIIPMAALHGVNADLLLETIQHKIPTPKRDLEKDPFMFIARSFDINKPGSLPEKMIGGVLGGALWQGQFKVDQDLEILPGYEVPDKKQWKPLTTKIITLMTGGEKVETVGPGGSIAVLTTLDPAVVKSDKLVGAAVGLPGKLPPVWNELTLEPHLLERMVGAKDKLVIEPVKLGEVLMLNVNSAATVGVVKSISKNGVVCTLRRPVCAAKGSRVVMSRMLGQRWRLIGYGMIK